MRPSAWLTVMLASALGPSCVASLAAQAPAPIRDPRVSALVEQISPERLHAIDEKLKSFGTRMTVSTNETGGRGIVAAREWMLSELRSYSPKLQASLDCYDVPEGGRIVRATKLCNVMAVLPGRSARRIYISGHYDSVARAAGQRFDWGRTDVYAPGADDDGSGTSLTMELARVFASSGLDFDATLVFICFAGEEEGLVGARYHAQAAAKDSVPIVAVINNDITGNSLGGDGTVDSRTVRVFSEGPMDSPSRELARFIRRWGEVYEPGHVVRLIAREDRFGRGGDHTAFNQVGYAGVRVSESREDYSRQHTTADTLIDPAYLAKNARIDAAAAATLALAPSQPDLIGDRGQPMLGRGDGYDAHLQWKPSAGATAYRIFWRSAWTPDWEHSLDVGDVTEATLPGITVDDYIFGVAAVDAAGHESLVSAYVRPPRRFEAVR